MDYTFMVNLHSGIRWLVMLAFILIIAKFALGTVQNSKFGALDSRLLSIYSLLAILQWVIGVVTILWLGSIATIVGSRWLHMLVMTLAVGIIASTSGRVRRSTGGDGAKFRTGLIGTLASAVTILIGITIVGGW